MSAETAVASQTGPAMQIAAAELPDHFSSLLAAGGRPHFAYAWRPTSDAIELRYVVTAAPGAPFQSWSVRPTGEVPSVAAVSPMLGWYEREIADLHGVTFADQPEPSRLVLHPGVETPVPPLDPRFPAGARLELFENVSAMPDVEGDDVQRLPWGPVRADVVESGEFVFFYIGEHILHLHTQLFFKHRGIEKRFQGLGAVAGGVLAERVSGVGSLAHALAYAQAVEAASGCEPPPRARLLRTLVAELERLYNHLHYLGHLAEMTTLKVGGAEGKLLEERAKQLNGQLTGSRFLRSLVTPGGLRRDLDPGDWLAAELKRLQSETKAYVDQLEDTGSYLDRLITTGVLSRQVALDQGATGPVARASGFDHDLRRDYPYAGYDPAGMRVPVRAAGDAHARAQVRTEEIDASFAIIAATLARLAPGPVRVDCPLRPGSEGLGWAESPRGALYYAVHVDPAGRLDRVKIKSPSFSNWRVFPFTVHDSNMMDYAINEASFGLTIAGCDR
ncbi:MAG TPA: NADH-quinone oxidoreductase subunit C [Caulobacteraceae bacterium]|nr:NADH-quinone oxidoreductase subunit C [Caulobacteraceae bacterium]